MQTEVRRHSNETPWTYAMAVERSREIADDVRAGRSDGVILLSEVAPVITIGNRTPSEHLFYPRAQYQEMGVEVLDVDRGGLATWHGPGQWIYFPVLNLERFTGSSKGVRIAVDQILETALTVARKFVPDVEVRAALDTGLWTPRGKLASIGIKIEDGVILHGLSLNVFSDPGSFAGLNACGLGVQPDFLLSESTAKSEIESAFLQIAHDLIH